MDDAEIFGFIIAVEAYLAGMAERGDLQARVLCGVAGGILDRLDEEGEA